MDPFIVDHLQRHNLYTDKPDTLYPILNDPHFNQPPPLERSDRDDIEAFIGELDLAESKILDAITVLKEKQEDIRRSRAYHRAVISPIRRLPGEMLEKIFLLSLPPVDLVRGSSVCPYDTNSTHWRSTHVCRRWRSIAINLPPLWARRIEITISPVRGLYYTNGMHRLPLSPGAVQLTKLYLERSHPSLISFDLRISCLDTEPPRYWASAFTDLLRDLFRHSTRLYHLSIDFKGFYPIIDPPSMIAPQFPQLLSFVYAGEATRAPRWLTDAIIDAPALKALRINPISFFPAVILPTLSTTLRGISRLDLGSKCRASPHVALLLISAMPRLWRCQLYIDAGRNEQQFFASHPLDPVSGLVKPPRLARLYLNSLHPIFDSLISKLELPSLRKVDVTTGDFPISNCIDRLIQNTKYHITSLAFRIHPGDNVDNLLSMLRNCPQLKSLTVRLVHPGLLKALFIGQDPSIQQNPICPRLTTLNLDLGFPQQQGRNVYNSFSADMIKSLVVVVRSRPLLSTAEVVLSCNPPLPSGDYCAPPSLSQELVKELWEECRPACKLSVKALSRIDEESSPSLRCKHRYDFNKWVWRQSTIRKQDYSSSL